MFGTKLVYFKMRRLFRQIFIGCKEASLLSSKEKEFGLNGWEKMTQMIHLSYCRMCRRFRKQLHLIHRSLFMMKGDDVTLSEEKKNNLKRLIEKEL